ncbi:MAG: hypothetical protein HY898_33185 [Deltaproteobacteria bacterium]|nr:hypothetical protein [Deltaproteobacteria bacterium]
MSHPNDPGRKRRESLPTPFLSRDDALLMVAPSQAVRVACVGVSMQMGLRPIAATIETMFQVAAAARPLAIVVEFDPDLDHARLTDLAVSVGAQVVHVRLVDTSEALIERIQVAVVAARALRAREEP